MIGGTGGSTRPTMRWPMTPTERTCRRFGVTVSTTLTWLPGTCFSRAGGTRYCSSPPRVWTISMPRPIEVLTEPPPELALDQPRLGLSVLQRQAKAGADEARQQRDRQQPRDRGRDRVGPAVDRRQEDQERRDDDQADDADPDRDVADAACTKSGA